MMRVPTLGLVTIFAMVGAAGSAHALNKCQSSKIQHALKKAVCLGGLEARRVKTGKPIDPVKVIKCEARFATAYAKLERKGGCNTTADTGTIETKVEAFVAELVNTLDVGAANCPGPPCAGFGQGCTAESDCCSNICDELGNPDFCAVAAVPGGCCQTSSDCAVSAPCSGGRCLCVPNGGSCGTNSHCCSNNCDIGVLVCQ